MWWWCALGLGAVQLVHRQAPRQRWLLRVCLPSPPSLVPAGFCYINDIVLAILELLKVHQRWVEWWGGWGLRGGWECTRGW